MFGSFVLFQMKNLKFSYSQSSFVIYIELDPEGARLQCDVSRVFYRVRLGRDWKNLKNALYFFNRLSSLVSNRRHK